MDELRDQLIASGQATVAGQPDLVEWEDQGLKKGWLPTPITAVNRVFGLLDRFSDEIEWDGGWVDLVEHLIEKAGANAE